MKSARASLPSPHHRLKGSDRFRARVGDYRIIYTFDLDQIRFISLPSDTAAKSIGAHNVSLLSFIRASDFEIRILRQWPIGETNTRFSKRQVSNRERIKKAGHRKKVGRRN